MKNALRIAPKTTETKLTLADINIEWSGQTTVGVSLVPILRFGGSQAISTHLQGLCDLLETHETLGVAELTFLRESLKALADRLFVFELDGTNEDDGAAANCKIVVRESRKKAVA